MYILNVLVTATPLNVFIYMTIVVKIAFVLSLCLCLFAVITLIVRPKRSHSKVLTVYGGVALSFSLFGAAYSGLNSYLGFVGSSNPYRTIQMVQAIIACAYVLAPGIIAWLIARYGNARLAA